MSLNTAHVNGGVLIYTGECILLFCDNVVMEFHGQVQTAFLGSKEGRLYLTTHRMIFNAKNRLDEMQSFSFPFVTLSEVDVEQPTFAANYIKGKCSAQPNGNWIGECKFKLHFKSGGAIEFGKAMLKAVAMVHRVTSRYAAPPPYEPPRSNWYAAPPPAYQASQSGYYGWKPPTNVFPEMPPANGVFMTHSPPPYVGIDAPYQGYASDPSQDAWGSFTQRTLWAHPQQNGVPGWANPNYNPQPMSQAGTYTYYGQPPQNPPPYNQYAQGDYARSTYPQQNSYNLYPPYN